MQWTERGVGLADLAGMLPAIAAPALLLFGERDPLIAKYERTALALMPAVRTVHVPRAGRFPHQEQPEASAGVLERFLAG